MLRRQLEHHGDVAELEVGVDEHDGRVAAAGPGRTRQVGGDDRLAGAALGGEDRDDLAELAVVDLADVGAADPAGGHGRARVGDAPDGLGRPAVSTGAASTSLTPARRAWRKSSVVSSWATRIAPDLGVLGDEPLGVGEARRATATRRAEHDDHRGCR